MSDSFIAEKAQKNQPKIINQQMENKFKTSHRFLQDLENEKFIEQLSKTFKSYQNNLMKTDIIPIDFS